MGARLDAPRFLDGPISSAWIRWPVSGAVAGSVALTLTLAASSGHLWQTGFLASLGWALAAVFTTPLLFLPFLFSYLVYVLVHRVPLLDTRVGAGVFGASWHVAAHSWVLSGLEAPMLHPSSLAPLIIGGLWGSWLPHATGLRFSRRRRRV